MEKSVSPVRCPWWDDAVRHLATDPVMKRLILEDTSTGMTASGDLMRSMVRAVTGQQVNNTAAVAAARRVTEVAEAQKGDALARGIVNAGSERLKAEARLTATKAKALTAIAEGWLAGALTPDALASLTDDEIFERLTALPGVGPWTAHMILIFGLNRPDVFPVGDFGVRKACENEFGNLKTAVKASEAWKPYRTAATWLLWRSRTKTPITY